MSKRRNDTTYRPHWQTPLAAVQPLLPYLLPNMRYLEPCAGDGALVQHLATAGHVCVHASDLNPLSDFIDQQDALTVQSLLPIVSNPPFEKALLVPLLTYWVPRQSAWLLLPTDCLFNLWAAPFVPYAAEIVPIGRVSWLGNGTAGMENFCWVRFSPKPSNFLHPRKPRP
jgi:hypothetical protein